MEWDKNRGYFYGVLLGDGHINHTTRSIENGNDPTNRRGPMLMLKVIDLDFIEAWRDAIFAITGFNYKISKHTGGESSKRQQYKLRVAQRELVAEAEMETKHKTVIPDKILSADTEVKNAFVTGLMDSEGWINCYLDSLKMADITLGFACADPWFDAFYSLVQELGVKVSKVYTRKPTKKKDGTPCKTIRLFRLDIPSYINAGLGFTIKRKADRLAFCSRILNDYMRNYPKYKDYWVEDIVWPAMKVAD